MQPTVSGPVAVVLEVLALLAGAACMALGVVLQFHVPAGAGVYAVPGGGVPLIITGATILVAAAHSSKWASVLLSKAPDAEKLLSEGETYLPLLEQFAPPQVHALIEAGVTDVDAILKALAAVEAAKPGTLAPEVAAQVAGAAAAKAPAKVL